jgi:hypothetical protein
MSLDFVSLLDFMSLLEEPDPALDFMSVEDELPPAAGELLEPPVAVLADGDDDEDEPELVLELGLADDFLSAPFVSAPVLAGVLVSALEPLPPDVAPAPALDEEPLPELLPPAPPPWANADVASIAPATVSAKALIHVFITAVLLLLVC